ncbi:MAG: DNA alkylation repair protein [Bacteroidales bacterium]|nr:DNA alkylation repair protein [Bacteroidales bacterium]
MNNSYLNELQKLFEENRNPENAAPMKKYMRNLFDYFGIKKPERTILQKSFFKKNGYPSQDNLENVLKELWDQAEREYQYFAMSLLEKMMKKPDKKAIGLYEYLITHKSWWDTVDLLAVNVVGRYFLQYPDQIKPQTTKWMASTNMWLQRTCILFQLKYKENTDLLLLEQFISQLSGSTEFFINKAIGWSLREYSKTDATYVVNLAKTIELAPLSKRESLKWLNRKKM